MTLKVSFFKDRQKFSAAHFTVFEDGDVERLHGHNYAVSVSLYGHSLNLGLMAPFHLLKREIDGACKNWDEYVLLPTACPFGQVARRNQQVIFHLETPLHNKRYSFPEEDVILLDCDNISCENLTLLFIDILRDRLKALPNPPAIDELEVTIGESAGQTVSLREPF